MKNTDKVRGILIRFDETEMREYAASIGWRPSDAVFWRGWHKARTAFVGMGMPEHLREESRAWLLAQDSEPWG